MADEVIKCLTCNDDPAQCQCGPDDFELFFAQIEQAENAKWSHCHHCGAPVCECVCDGGIP